MEDKKQVLIIEDHDCIRLLLGRFLGKKYAVATRKDGLEAMAWLGQGNIPDVIILDMEMPRINGLEFLTNLRSSGFFHHLPVLVVSGSENPRLLLEYNKLGINGFIAKPFNPVNINETIAQILGESPPIKAVG